MFFMASPFLFNFDFANTIIMYMLLPEQNLFYTFDAFHSKLVILYFTELNLLQKQKWKNMR